jgi:hypothetical protein
MSQPIRRMQPPPYDRLQWRYSYAGGPDEFEVRDRLQQYALVAAGLTFEQAREATAQHEAARERCEHPEPVCWYCPGQALELGDQDPDRYPAWGEMQGEARCPRCGRWWPLADVAPCPWPLTDVVTGLDGGQARVCHSHAALAGSHRPIAKEDQDGDH